MRRTLIASEPAEGTLNGFSIGIYETEERGRYALTMFKEDARDENGAYPVYEWSIAVPDLNTAKAIARKYLWEKLPTAGSA